MRTPLPVGAVLTNLPHQPNPLDAKSPSPLPLGCSLPIASTPVPRSLKPATPAPKGLGLTSEPKTPAPLLFGPKPPALCLIPNIPSPVLALASHSGKAVGGYACAGRSRFRDNGSKSVSRNLIGAPPTAVGAACSGWVDGVFPP